MPDLWPVKLLPCPVPGKLLTSPTNSTPSAHLMLYPSLIRSWNWYYGVWMIFLVFLCTEILFALSCVGSHRCVCLCVGLCGMALMALQLFGAQLPHCLLPISKRVDLPKCIIMKWLNHTSTCLVSNKLNILGQRFKFSIWPFAVIKC